MQMMHQPPPGYPPVEHSRNPNKFRDENNNIANVSNTHSKNHHERTNSDNNSSHPSRFQEVINAQDPISDVMTGISTWNGCNSADNLRW
jgi:hypothetical protein